MKTANFICRYLKSLGYKYVFGVTGGGIVRMFDAARAEGLKTVHCMHEQGASLAAVAHSMLNGKGLCFITTGPGGTNAMTGLLGSYQDSIPTLYISGQARSNQMAYGRDIRQGAAQDYHIIDSVKPMCKYTHVLLPDDDVKAVIDNAVKMMNSGRPGPAWIDIPIDTQWEEYDDHQSEPIEVSDEEYIIDSHVKDIISSAKRPLILVGYGSRLSYQTDRIVSIATRYKIPVVTTRNTMDIMDYTHPEHLGVVGTVGGRRGSNLAMYNADVVISLGSRLPTTVVGNSIRPFSRNTEVIMVDIDPNELMYRKDIATTPVYSSVEYFLDCVEDSFQMISEDWQKMYGKYKVLNNVYLDQKISDRGINTYIWMYEFDKWLDPSDTIVIDGGGSIHSAAYGTLNLHGSRCINLCGISSMGTGIAMSIGASFATNNRAIVLCGDGSLMMSPQELAVVSGLNLPVKLFIIDNAGYLSIRNTQDAYFGSRYIGSSKEGDLMLPHPENIIRSYDIPTVIVYSHDDLDEKLDIVMGSDEPSACVLRCDPKQPIYPTPTTRFRDDGTSYQVPLYDMTPSIDLTEYMLVDYER